MTQRAERTYGSSSAADIVDRLYALHKQMERERNGSIQISDCILEARAVIQRLRGENDRLHKLVDLLE